VTPYYEHAGISIFHGDCREILPSLQVQFSACIADPPYGDTSLEWDRKPGRCWVQGRRRRTRAIR
jgi:hypothetical protein